LIIYESLKAHRWASCKRLIDKIAPQFFVGNVANDLEHLDLEIQLSEGLPYKVALRESAIRRRAEISRMSYEEQLRLHKANLEGTEPANTKDSSDEEVDSSTSLQPANNTRAGNNLHQQRKLPVANIKTGKFPSPAPPTPRETVNTEVQMEVDSSDDEENSSTSKQIKVGVLGSFDHRKAPSFLQRVRRFNECNGLTLFYLLSTTTHS
jgi:hypothetical protein